ncbi:MAG: DNA-processing protein DprA, partial [Gemmataceae bacterium]
RLDAGGLAVVGSRDVDEGGLAFTRRVAERCARGGVAVVSGAARGVDRAAMEAALNAGGHAVGVLADRLDKAATARDAKPPLRDGRLTLVSPYEPEAAFTVGRAMGRNKHVYALADHALVVRFTTDEGGTWAGAVERLKANGGDGGVPVFVRVEGNPADGWGRLNALGALPFPAEGFERDGVEALRRPAAVERVTPPEPPPATTPRTCYEACLPLILPHLRGEPGAAELAAIAKALELSAAQLTAWLKRAVKDGRVGTKKKGRKAVYFDPAAVAPAALFAGDAA